MSGYRRFVAYVYEYQKGKKGRNCGFIRVEAKEQVCRMEAHILCPGLTPDVKCEIFGFTRKTGLLDGVLLGSCMTEDSRADCVLETERNHMGGSAMTLENMGGMILLTENGAFFGTEWDDKPIRPENFRRVKEEKTENKSSDKEIDPQNSTMNREASEESAEEVKSEEEHVFGETKSEEEMQNPLMKDDHNCREMHDPETASEEKIQSNRQEEINAELKKDSENKITERKQKNQSEENDVSEIHRNLETKNTVKTEEENNVYKKMGNSGIRAGVESVESQPQEDDACQISQNMGIKTAEEVQEEAQKDKTSEKNPDPSENNLKQKTITADGDDIHTEYLTSQSVAVCNQEMTKAKEKSLSFGEPFNAFGDGEICHCRKIQPADLCHFHPRDCALRNNRFLQYGFYNFGHLLIGKNSSGHYILGVPGGYDQQERFMANMFGFPYFKESRQIQLPKSRGGYWYRLINPPKFY